MSTKTVSAPQTRVQVLRPGWGFTPVEFVRWTPSYLVLRYPASKRDWMVSRRQVAEWLSEGSLRIEGEIPAGWRDVVTPVTATAAAMAPAAC